MLAAVGMVVTDTKTPSSCWPDLPWSTPPPPPGGNSGDDEVDARRVGALRHGTHARAEGRGHMVWRSDGGAQDAPVLGARHYRPNDEDLRVGEDADGRNQPGDRHENVEAERIGGACSNVRFGDLPDGSSLPVAGLATESCLSGIE